MKVFLILLALLAILCISIGVFTLFIPAVFLIGILWCALKVANFSSSLRGAGRRHRKNQQ